jgi:hypothetical protein
MAASLTNQLQRTAEEALEISTEGFLTGDRLLDGFFGGGALVAKIDEGRENVFDGGPFYGRGGRCDCEVIELVLQFDDQALSELFPHAGNARQLRVILCANGLDGAFR